MRNFNQYHFLNYSCQQFNVNLTQNDETRTFISLTFVNYSRKQLINMPLGDLLQDENNSKGENPGSLMDFKHLSKQRLVYQRVLSNSKHMKVTINII